MFLFGFEISDIDVNVVWVVFLYLGVFWSIYVYEFIGFVSFLVLFYRWGSYGIRRLSVGVKVFGSSVVGWDLGLGVFVFLYVFLGGFIFFY